MNAPNILKNRKGIMRLKIPMRITACHEAGHTLIAYLLGVGIDYVTIDPHKKDTPVSKGHTKYSGGKSSWRYNSITQMLFMAGILAQDHPGQRLEELLGATEDLEFCPYVGEKSRDRPFINRHFRNEYPDLAKFCDVDRIVQARIGCRLNLLTKDIIKEERASLKLIASSLLKKKTLTGQEIHDLLKVDDEAQLKFQKRMWNTMYDAIDEAIEACKEFKKEEMKKFMMGQWRQ